MARDLEKPHQKHIKPAVLQNPRNLREVDFP